MPDKTLFLTLRIFSATGGIEKVSRIAGKALYELSIEQPDMSFQVFSMYDKQSDVDEKYFPATVFKGFYKNKRRFVSAAIQQGVKCNRVILSHSNLLLAGFLIKLFSPKTSIILLAHGIEVWDTYPYWKKYMLRQCDQVFAVSNFTRQTMLNVHGLDEKRITVLNNCLDPFLPEKAGIAFKDELIKRYQLAPGEMVLLTITRLSSLEKYKGYDNVFYAIKELKDQYPFIKYLVVGKYDAIEKQRVDAIVAELEIHDNIIFTGFIPDEELAAHYNIADIYIMPSKKEGFGIVFIEAMYYGKPVIAGNKDGSADALDNGKLGLLINPDDVNEISKAIIKVITNKADYIPDFQAVMAKFSFLVYKKNLAHLLSPNGAKVDIPGMERLKSIG